MIMAKKKQKKEMLLGNKIALFLLLLAAVLTVLQFVFKTYFDIDLGITFFGKEMF